MFPAIPASIKNGLSRTLHTHVKSCTTRCKDAERYTRKKKMPFRYLGGYYAVFFKENRLHELIEMGIETDFNLPLVSSKPYMVPLKHPEWVRKDLQDLEKAGLIQKSISSYASPTVKVPRECPQDSPIQETKKIMCGLQEAKHTISYCPCNQIL